jgi:hypothetical protein
MSSAKRSPKPELATIVHRFGKQLLDGQKLSPTQLKALKNIAQCRTSAMGGHEEVCEHCGEKRYSYNSCGDRHCPKCQITKQMQWVEEITKLSLPVKHFHVIFTLPHHLNKVCLWNPKIYYSILFKSLWRTLHSFGYSEHGVESGAIAILHSWGQNLSLHPHVHCIVPAAGYSLKGEWKHIGQETYLYPVHQLSATFKGKFMDSLKRKLKQLHMLKAFDKQIQLAFGTPWVVHSEPPLSDASNVIRYLGQYTHRVAISNDRILDITPTHVKFIAKDYRDQAKPKPVYLRGEEFLRRFCQHVMPKGFVRIRRFGIYNSTTIRRMGLVFRKEQDLPKSPKTEKVKKETALQCYIRLTGFDPCICPKCNQRAMKKVAVIPRIRSPAENMLNLLRSKLL